MKIVDKNLLIKAVQYSPVAEPSGDEYFPFPSSLPILFRKKKLNYNYLYDTDNDQVN